MAHAGLENGRLIVTYLQFIEFGIYRRMVTQSIAEAEERGLIEVMFRGWRLKDTPNRYRLTYYATGTRIESGAVEWSAPTNEWRRYGKHSQDDGSLSDTAEFTLRQRENIPARKHSPETAETLNPGNVFFRSKGALLIKSSGSAAGTARSENIGATAPPENNTLPDRKTNGVAASDLRAAIADLITRTGRGEQQRIAEHLAITRGALSNFLAGRRSISEKAEAALREYLSSCFRP